MSRRVDLAELIREAATRILASKGCGLAHAQLSFALWEGLVHELLRDDERFVYRSGAWELASARAARDAAAKRQPVEPGGEELDAPADEYAVPGVH